MSHRKLNQEQMKTYEFNGYRPDKAAEQTQFYQDITVTDNKLAYVAYIAIGVEYDRAVIVKKFSNGKKQLFQNED